MQPQVTCRLPLSRVRQSRIVTGIFRPSKRKRRRKGHAQLCAGKTRALQGKAARRRRECYSKVAACNTATRFASTPGKQVI